MILSDYRMTTGGATGKDDQSLPPSVYAVVLAGGRGERFWPVSTDAQPKAFLRLVGNESLLQATVRRIRLLLPWTQIAVVAGETHAELVRAQLPELPKVISCSSRRAETLRQLSGWPLCRLSGSTRTP